MALELHVWGPAFGLDSIDPECLGAIACFRHFVSRKDWTLIASNDAAVSPNYHLPALHHGGTWTSGYTNIVSYLTGCGKLSIDDDLTPLQKADALAYASFLTTRGAGLVATSLYVSPRAWADVTRPAYSSLLRFPLTWTVPPAVRAAAVAKAAHLGLGYLAADVDTEEETSSSSNSLAETTSTGFLRIRERLGPSRALQPEHTAAIRLQHFAEDFYSAMDEARGGKRFFLRDDGPSSLDFLAYGYLQLLRVRTPHAVLKNVLERSYPQLVAFLGEVESCGQHASTTQEDLLVWQEPEPRGVLRVIGRFAEGSLEAVPGVGDSWARWRKGGGVRDSSERDSAKDSSSQLIVAVGGAIVSVAALGAVALFRALPPLGASTHRFEPAREKTGLRQFGEIGSILEGLPVWEQQPNGFLPR